MKYSVTFGPTFLTLLVLLSGQVAVAQTGGLVAGPYPDRVESEACLSDAQIARRDAELAIYSPPRPDLPNRAVTLPIFEFYPMAGTLYRDIYVNNFVDLDDTSAVLDFDCDTRSYDGHDASDVDIKTFAEQAVGVPIFAVLEGTVLTAHDGEPDTNTCFGAECGDVEANYVSIDHGDGLVTYYYHMKTGSVAVSPRQTVVAGQQIGLIGSSGFSTGPHLHFSTYLDGQNVEPFTGICHVGSSWWVNQPDTDPEHYVYDAGVTHESTGTFPAFTEAFPASGQLAVTDTIHYVWARVHEHPANSTWRFRHIRPDGSTAYDSGTIAFGNTDYFRTAWWAWSWNITDMQSITGTWTLLIDFNDVTMVTLPVEVRTERTGDFNRAPASVPGAFDPAVPEPGDVVFCRLDSNLVNDDPDYDLVRYNYVWKVSGAVVRDVESAALSDAIPRGLFDAGDTLECTVTPSDGILDGPSTVVSTLIGSADEVWADFSWPVAGSGTEPDPFSMMSTALAFVNPGGTIYIAPGAQGITGEIDQIVTLVNEIPQNGVVTLGSESTP